MNHSHRKRTAIVAFVAAGLAVATESRAQIDLTQQGRPTLDASSYSYVAALRIPRRDVRDLATLIERRVSPLVERGRALAAGPYAILIETDGVEYVIHVVTAQVPPQVQRRLEGLPASTLGADETVEPVRPDRFLRSSEEERDPSRAP